MNILRRISSFTNVLFTSRCLNAKKWSIFLSFYCNSKMVCSQLDSFLKTKLTSITSLQSVTLHTDVGDIKIELFCDDCPKTCENFLALCASDYYNNSLFHRNIKGFICQTGDPTSTGKGGQSIWGRKFEDEFKDTLKHNERGMVSMANK